MSGKWPHEASGDASSYLNLPPGTLSWAQVGRVVREKWGMTLHQFLVHEGLKRVPLKEFPFTDLEVGEMVLALMEEGITRSTKNHDPSIDHLTDIPNSRLSDLERHVSKRGLSFHWYAWTMRQGALTGPPLDRQEVEEAAHALPRGARARIAQMLDRYTPDSTKAPPGIHIMRGRGSRPFLVPVGGRREHALNLDLALRFGWRGLDAGPSLREKLT